MKERELKRLFQDQNGTPVTEVGQPVGFILDKAQDTLEGAEIVSEGDFEATVSAWTGLDENSQFSSTNRKPKSIIIAIGQSNIDGSQVPIHLPSPPAAPFTPDPNIDSDLIGPIEGIKIWTPNSLTSIDGIWRTLDAENNPFGPAYQVGYAGLNATRYQIQGNTNTRFDVATARTYDPLIPFLDKLKDYDDEDEVFLIKNTRGSTAMVSGIDNVEINGLRLFEGFSWTDETNPDYNIQGTGLYTTLINDISGAIQQLVIDYPEDDFELKAVLVWQGETESLFNDDIYFPNYQSASAAAASWGDAFLGFYNKFQQDMITMVSGFLGTAASAVRFPGTSEGPEPGIPIPFFLARTHSEYRGSGEVPAPSLSIVREQQELIAAYGAANEGFTINLVDLDGVGEHLAIGDEAWVDTFGKVHFSVLGLNLIADRFFNAYATHYPKINNSLSVYNGAANQVFSSVPGLAYHFTADVNSPIAGPSLKLGTTSGAGDIYTFDLSGENSVSRYFRASTSSTYVTLSNPYEFDPATLFASGEEGAWYDPSDFTTMFEDSTGTIPVTGAGQPVGLILDKSKGLELGSEVVTNGTFDTDSNWTKDSHWTISGGVASSINGSLRNLAQVCLTVGKTYKVSWDQTTSSGNIGVFVGLGTQTPAITGTGTKTAICKAVTNTTLYFQAQNGFTGTIDNISVKELPGYHAYQNTSTARPILQESNGLYYLDFDGVDDQLIATGYPWTSGDSYDLFFAINANTAKTYQLLGLGEVGNAAAYNIVAHDGNTSTQLYNSHTSVSYRVNGSDPLFTNRNSVFDAVVIDSEIVVGCINCQPIGIFSPAIIHGYIQANLNLRGRSYGWIIRDSMTTAERESVEYYLAQKSGVTSVPSPSDPVTYDNISLKQVAGLHAYQNTSTARPLLQQSNGAYYLAFDGVDDRLLIDLPGNLRGTSIMSDVEGTAAYGVNIPSGTFVLGANAAAVTYSFNKNLLGSYTRNIPMSESEISTVFDYFREGGASAVGEDAYQDVSNFIYKWRNTEWITEFPLIDTSKATSFYGTWRNCTNLVSFPLIDTSNATDLTLAWYQCLSLSSFPLIDTSKATNITQAWSNCANLSSFPAINTSAVTVLVNAWYNCNSLTSFPLIDTSKVGNFAQVWTGCTSLSSFPLIDTSQGTNFFGAWASCFNLSSFPLIDTSKGTTFDRTWRACTSLTSFPEIDTSKGTNFFYTWENCPNLSSFPALDFSLGTNFLYTWANCTSLEVFPSGVFDNTSGTTDFTYTFLNSKLNTQSLDNVLVSINNANTYSGTLNLSSTNMGLPSVPGIAAKYQLENRAWTVNTKAVDSDTAASALFYLDDGAWYDVNDLSTMFQDSAGTTPVTAAGQPVGLMLDKSKGLVLGEELVTNGTFDTDTSGWTPTNALLSVNAQRLVVENSDAVQGNATHTFATEIGKRYRASFEVFKVPGQGNPIVRLGTGPNSNAYYSVAFASDASVQFYFRATTNNTTWTLYTGSTTSGYTGIFDNISIKELSGYHAYQNTNTARPTLQGSAGDYYLDSDLVDDRLLVDLPAISGTAVIASEEGTAAYGVNFPAGTHALITNTSATNYSFAKDLVGQFIRERAMGPTEVSAAYDYFVDQNAGPVGENAYSGNTSVYQYWRNSEWLVDMPLINTSNVVGSGFRFSWYQCYNLKTFPLLNTSGATEFNAPWFACFSLTSFPLIDTSNATNFSQAWQSCTGLVDFPLINTERATSLNQAWYSCLSLTSFPAINTSAVTNFNSPWLGCNSLSSFPLIDTSQGTNFTQAWMDCTSLASFPLIDVGSATTLYRTWRNCQSLSSFPSIDTSQVTSMQEAWLSCTSLSSFPLIDTSQVTNFFRAWYNCISLTSFPAINTSASTSMGGAWYNCNNLTTFPWIDTSQVTDLGDTWMDCDNLSSFPVIDTSNVTNFYRTWSRTNLVSFPVIDLRSGTNFTQTWYSIVELQHFPAGMFDNVSGTTDFSSAFTLNNLTTQSIDNIIVSINNANTYSGTLTFDTGSTKQPPSYWGIAASGELANRGWTVTTKTPTAEDQLDATIAPLYFSGDDGAWYDVNDLDTMFEDFAGTIPVTGAGQPVGLLLDKSKGLQLGNEVLVNPTWSVPTDGFVSDGELHFTGTTTVNQTFTTTVTEFAPGKRFLVQFEVFDWVAGSVAVLTSNNAGGGTTVSLGTGNGLKTAIVPVGSIQTFLIRTGSIGGEFSIRNISLRELPGNHAIQTTSTARPLLVSSVDGYTLQGDGVDDRLIVSMPEVIGTAVISTQEGTAEYGVNIPAGDYDLLTNEINTVYTSFFRKNLVGSIFHDGAMTSGQVDTTFDYFTEKGASAVGASAFQDTTNFTNYWRRAAWITDFPLIDTSKATNLGTAWNYCVNLSSFPLIDTSQAISLAAAWTNCQSLTEFPVINVNSVVGTGFNNTWQNCTSLSSFPLLDTSQATRFDQTWRGCTSLTGFPAINTSSVTSFNYSWFGCTSLESFPAIDTSQATTLSHAWYQNYSLTSFPWIDTSKVTNLSVAWGYCNSLSSFPQLNTSAVTNFDRTWTGCTSLSSFALIDTSQGTNFQNTWGGCSNLSSFPLIDTSQGSTFVYTWFGCNSLTSFPLINTSQGTNFSHSWYQNTSLSSFPQIDTSQGTSFVRTWTGCVNLSSFPQIDCRSATDMFETWKDCTNLENFPSGVFDNTSGTVDFSTTFFNTKLNSQSVDNVLVSINNANTASGDIQLVTTNIQPPGVAGTAAKFKLEGRDWTVNTKAVDTDTQASALFHFDDGAWYDVNDLSTMFEDSAGTIPVTGAGQPVGLLLDKSRSNVSTADFVTNGAFDDASGWTLGAGWSVSGGVATFDGTSETIYTTPNFPLVEGKTYVVSFDVVTRTAGFIYPRIGGVIQDYDQRAATPGSYSWVVRVTNLTAQEIGITAGNGPQNISVDNFSVKENPGYHAYQETSTQRPVLQGSAGDYYLDYDGVDDRLLVYLPATSGTAVIASEEGTAAYGVSFPAGIHSLITNSTSVNYSFAKDFVGQMIREGSMNSSEVSAAYDYFVDQNAGPVGENAYIGVTSLSSYWRRANWITDFPLIDTSQVTNLITSWYECTNLRSFPEINTSAVTRFDNAWAFCNNLSSFPEINTSAATAMNQGWRECRSLTSFPVIDTSQVNNFQLAWYNCVSLSSFPLLDTSQGTSFRGSWAFCSNLSSFPLIDTGKGTDFYQGWDGCTNLSSFPEINTSAGTNFSYAWRNCRSLSSFPLIDTSQGTTLAYAWQGCNQLTDFPAINTSAATSLASTWHQCNSISSFPWIDTSQVTSLASTWGQNTSLSSFPLIDTGKVTNFYFTWGDLVNLSSFPAINTSSATSLEFTWRNCSNLSSFPAINTSAVTAMRQTWGGCTSLESFPLIDTSQSTTLYYCWHQNYNLTSFPAINTSGVTDFQQTWHLCGSLSSFPQIDCRSATNLNYTWLDCTSLEHFPAGVFDNTSGTTNFSTTFQNTKLNTQSIDNVILSINNADTSSGTLTLNFTNTQPPSYWGIVASGQLEDRGWNVTTKTPTASALEDSEIAAMFFSGDEGAWYDPADFSTMFEDSIGTIPVTASGQPVGLILDKSKGLQLGNELVESFDSSLWTALDNNTIVDDENGNVVITYVDNTTGGSISLNAVGSSNLVSGKWYKFSVTINTGDDTIGLLRATSLNPNLNIQVNTANQFETFEHYFQSDGSEVFQIRSMEEGEVAIISNISIRELPGNHASQSTSTARPTLQTDASGHWYLDFDGVDDWLRATFSSTQTQPNTIAAAFKFNVTNRLDHVFDGADSNRHTLYKATTYLRMYAGAFVDDSSDAGSLERVALSHFNTTSSELRVDGLQVATGDAGSLSWGGVTLAAGHLNQYPLNGRIYGYIGISRTLSPTEISTTETYLANKSGVTL